MTVKQPSLPDEAFEAFGHQVLNGAELCADRQILDLADRLHDIIRSRRNARWSGESRSFDPAPAHDLMAAASQP